MESRLKVDEVEQAAAAWLLRRDAPHWSAADETELGEWLTASTHHRVAFARLKSVWRETGRLKVLDPMPATGSQALPGRSKSATRYKAYAVAAALVLMVCASVVAYFFGSQEAPSYRTPVGGLVTVPMPDGSKITLNTDSEMTLQIDGRERRVNLKRGEAFFEVAPDPTRPFVVYANDQRVIAVGTKFAVRLESQEVRVAVTEGLVRMERRSSLLDPAEQTASAPLLTPGTVASASDKQISLQQRPLDSVEQDLSWRLGYIVLRATALPDAIAEFNRYNARQLVLGDPALADIVVGGNFRADNIDGFVRLLREGFGIRAQEHERQILLGRGGSLPAAGGHD